MQTKSEKIAAIKQLIARRYEEEIMTTEEEFNQISQALEEEC